MRDIRLRYGNGGSISLVALYAAFVSVCYILPVIKYSVPYIILGGALLLTYILAVLSGKIDLTVLVPTVCCASGLMLMVCLITRPGNLTEGINEFIRALRFVAPGILFLALCSSGERSKWEKRMVFAVITAVMLFVCYRTLVELNENSMIARLLAMGSLVTDEFKALRFENVGSFEFSYAIGFLGMFFFFLALERRISWFWRLVALGLFLYIGYYIVRAQYMTLLILMVGSSVLILLSSVPGKAGKLLVLLICFALIPMLPKLVETIGAAGEDSTEMLLKKFENMELASEQNDIRLLGARQVYYRQAILNFMESPLWGQSVMRNGFLSSDMLKYHSTLLGCLQNTGLIGATMFYCPVICLMRACYRQLRGLSGTAGVFWVCICGVFLTLSALNPIDYSFEICFVVFLCIPCGMKVFLGKSGEGDAIYESIEDVEE